MDEIRDLPVAPEGQEYLVVVNCGWQRKPNAIDALFGAIKNGAYFKDQDGDEPNWVHIVLVDPEDMDVSVGFSGAEGPGIIKDIARFDWQKMDCPEVQCDFGGIWVDTGNPEDEEYLECERCKGMGWLLK